jgi:SAM-dependent methyltransferase
LADARQIPFSDQSFDLVFSNSVIEHVGHESDQFHFVQECERVGKEIYIQTPNRWFPLEPHIYTIFIHWLPKFWYKRLLFLSALYIFYIPTKNAAIKTNEMVDGTNLLSLQQVKKLFPGKNIETERVFGLAKSFIITDRKILNSAWRS